MPAITVFAIRVSLGYLLLGTAFGALLLAAKEFQGLAWVAASRPAHVEMLLFGFMLQLAFGIAYWILPRTPRRQATWPFAAVLVFLNVSVMLASLGPLVGSHLLVLIGRLGLLAAVLGFAAYVWPRVRPVVSSAR